MRFDISETPGGATVVFTHDGLTHDDECYDTCSNAWSMFVNGSLKRFIETGRGAPYVFGGDEALSGDDHEALHQEIADTIGAER